MPFKLSTMTCTINRYIFLKKILNKGGIDSFFHCIPRKHKKKFQHKFKSNKKKYFAKNRKNCQTVSKTEANYLLSFYVFTKKVANLSGSRLQKPDTFEVYCLWCRRQKFMRLTCLQKEIKNQRLIQCFLYHLLDIQKRIKVTLVAGTSDIRIARVYK